VEALPGRTVIRLSKSREDIFHGHGGTAFFLTPFLREGHMAAILELVSWEGARMDAGLFGKRLKELRERAGLSQAELARLANLSQKGISNWELGQREPGLAAAVALARALGVEVVDFLEEPKKPRKGRRKS
jgi:DNA-binding XRE family transcriptional regulator